MRLLLLEFHDALFINAGTFSTIASCYDNSVFRKGITCSCGRHVKTSFNLKRLSTDRTLINNIRDNCVPLK